MYYNFKTEIWCYNKIKDCTMFEFISKDIFFMFLGFFYNCINNQYKFIMFKVLKQNRLNTFNTKKKLVLAI